VDFDTANRTCKQNVRITMPMERGGAESGSGDEGREDIDVPQSRKTPTVAGGRNP
jgi:hypothetical protein